MRLLQVAILLLLTSSDLVVSAEITDPTFENRKLNAWVALLDSTDPTLKLQALKAIQSLAPGSSHALLR